MWGKEEVEVGLDFEALERATVPVRISGSTKSLTRKQHITCWSLIFAFSRTRDTSTQPIYLLSNQCYVICQFFGLIFGCIKGRSDCALNMAGNSSTISGAMRNTPSEGVISSTAEALPDGFMSIRQIQELPPERIKQSALVNVIGLVTDFQAPIQSNGSGKSSTCRHENWC